MTNGSGVSRGDRNRNERLSRLRDAVPVSNAIVGIDVADRKLTCSRFPGRFLLGDHAAAWAAAYRAS